MKITRRPTTVEIRGEAVTFHRNADGVVCFRTRDDQTLAAGLGFVHAHERLVQMDLVRLIAQGRLGECLEANDETLNIDLFMRQMGFARTAAAEVSRMSPAALAIADAYAAGVNRYLQTQGRPTELWLAGRKPQPWTPADTLATIKIMAFVGLAQTQQDLERLIVESVKAGVDPDKLRHLFAPHLNDMDAERLQWMRACQWHGSPLPVGMRMTPLPAIAASNNWALSPARSKTGGALLAGDPHLECNRLPAVWYEIVAQLDEGERMGVTMPGLPGLIMGRNRDLAWNFTYGYMDMNDTFIEECAEGAYRHGDAWRPLQVRREVVKRKKKPEVVAHVFETHHGRLETDPLSDRPPEGKWLCAAFSMYDRGAAEAMDALLVLQGARTVAEGQEALGRVCLSASWLLADSAGNIGMQQSGYLPRRKGSGLLPVPGWDPAYDWDGIEAPSKLMRHTNPQSGVLVTANDDQGAPGGPLSINAHAGDYRRQRIDRALAQSDVHDVDGMMALQRDVYSVQAERFMDLLMPHLPDTTAGRILREWDRCYDAQSQGAALFEGVYAALMAAVYTPVFGAEAWEAITRRTYVFAVYAHVFDAPVLADAPGWFAPRTRDEVIAVAVAETLGPDVQPVPLSRIQTFTMKHVLFDGRLPSFSRVDRGPFALPGGRSTICQGQSFHAHGRHVVVAPSWRMVADLSRAEMATSLAGGPSGRPWSRHYASEVLDWLAGRFKTLRN